LLDDWDGETSFGAFALSRIQKISNFLLKAAALHFAAGFL